MPKSNVLNKKKCCSFKCQKLFCKIFFTVYNSQNWKMACFSTFKYFWSDFEKWSGGGVVEEKQIFSSGTQFFKSWKRGLRPKRLGTTALDNGVYSIHKNWGYAKQDRFWTNFKNVVRTGFFNGCKKGCNVFMSCKDQTSKNL